MLLTIYLILCRICGNMIVIQSINEYFLIWNMTMLLFWKIRYFDRKNRQFKDRCLWLDTSELDSTTKAAVELCNEIRYPGNDRRMLRYRTLFIQQDYSADDLNKLLQSHSCMEAFCIIDYFEDENGTELTNKQLAVLVTGNPDVVVSPSGSKQCDIDYVLADKKHVSLQDITLSSEQLYVLGYFARDLGEMINSAFYREGPGSINRKGESDPSLQTAVTDDEIRSFVTIFRRLYMQKEPANFRKAVNVFARITDGFAISKWINAVACEYESELKVHPEPVPFVSIQKLPFSRKRLVDAYLYTRYAHQPDSKKIRQYREYLEAVNGHKELLMWLFLNELWQCSIIIRNGGVTIAQFYERYCKYHNLEPEILDSVALESPHIGSQEKREEHLKRILNESSARLAHDLWIERGCPEGGPSNLLHEACELLKSVVF